jgi:putative addiction module killer protein
MNEAIEIRRYVTRSGRDVVGEWLDSLADKRARAKILVRLDRLAAGNLGDTKGVGGGLQELRIDWGPGYRVYFAWIGRQCVLLLGGGDKRRQSADIKTALERLDDYKKRADEAEHFAR